MRVAIVGAGALGSVYGAHLGRAGCDVEVLSRGPSQPVSVLLERVDAKTGGSATWSYRSRAGDQASPEADVVLVCVRYEQLDAALATLTRGHAPVVVMTPMMPQDYARLSAALPGRVVAAMPSVVAYRNEAGAVRYWLPRSATTLVEEQAGSDAPGGLVDALRRAGITAKLATGVLARNVATTVSFFPLAVAIDATGSVDATLADDALLSLALEACDEGRELARKIGPAEAWATTLMRFVGPRLLKVGAGIARARAREALAYVEIHFGKKLHAQNLAIGARIVELARETGTRFDALARLLARLPVARAAGNG